jgi:cyclopropane fatty-acyl-phospholipid synthase-like methyltransferase
VLHFFLLLLLLLSSLSLVVVFVFVYIKAPWGATPFSAVIKNGGSLLGADSGEKDSHPFWVKFAQVTGNGMKAAAEGAASIAKESVKLPEGRKLQVLDIASGSGAYGFMAARTLPNSQVTLFDFDATLAVTKKNVPDDLKVGENILFQSGDFFKGVKGKYDVILVPNFYHHFSKSVALEITRTIHGLLNDNGAAVIVEFCRPEHPQPNDEVQGRYIYIYKFILGSRKHEIKYKYI